MADHQADLLSAVQPSHPNLELLKSLLYCGASPDARNENGSTCLHLLAGSDHADADECMDVLLDYGAHSNVRTPDDGLTPLHIASNWGKDDLIRRLLSAGADVTALSNDQETPLDLAPNKKTAKLLQLCMDSTGLTVLAQPQISTVNDPRFFESTVLYDLSDLADPAVEHIEVPSSNHAHSNGQSPAVTSPLDAACYYNSDDSVLDPTDSDTTPTQQPPIPASKAVTFSEPETCGARSPNTVSDQRKGHQIPPSQRKVIGGLVSSENADLTFTVSSSNGTHKHSPKQLPHCTASPRLPSLLSPKSEQPASRSEPHCSTTDTGSESPALRGILKPCSRLNPSPHEERLPLTSVPLKPSTRANLPVRDTTFRLSIGSPTIPSQEQFESELDSPCIPADTRALGASQDVHYIEARKPWHSVSNTGDTSSQPRPAVASHALPSSGHAQPSSGLACSANPEVAEHDVSVSQVQDISASLVVPEEICAMSNNAIRTRLLELGEQVGPVTDGMRTTYQRYLTRLEVRAKMDVSLVTSAASGQTVDPSYSKELYRCLTGKSPIPSLLKEEADLVPVPRQPTCRVGSPLKQAQKAAPRQDYVSKAFFIYFLLDPSISCNLPLRAANDSLSELECFQQFIASIFYIGKGKRSRPFAHLHDAAKYCQCHTPSSKQPKLERIKQIWQSGQGVVQFSCFQGATSEEAHTREACCLDAIAIKNLTNKVAGTYYGMFATRPGTVRRTMGVYLLSKACRIFLQEGERQYRSNVPT